MLHLIKRRIKSHFIQNYTLPDLNQFLKRVKGLNYNPKIVFDVGAYEGSFARLSKSVWRNAEIYCFEGLEDKVRQLSLLAKEFSNITVIQGLVGEKDLSEVPFHKAETASSVLPEHVENNFPMERVKMHRLDTLIAKGIIPIPSFLKIDTQGYEYQVLQGLGKYLDDVDMILAELNFIDIHKNVVLASEIISFLREKNFVPFDVTEIHRRPLDKSVNQIDLVFVKEDSFLRKEKSWST